MPCMAAAGVYVEAVPVTRSMNYVLSKARPSGTLVAGVRLGLRPGLALLLRRLPSTLMPRTPRMAPAYWSQHPRRLWSCQENVQELKRPVGARSTPHHPTCIQTNAATAGATP